jgi:hypothetical protein
MSNATVNATTVAALAQSDNSGLLALAIVLPVVIVVLVVFCFCMTCSKVEG